MRTRGLGGDLIKLVSSGGRAGALKDQRKSTRDDRRRPDVEAGEVSVGRESGK